MKKAIFMCYLLILASCAEERLTPTSETESNQFSKVSSTSAASRFTEIPTGEQLILGEKLENPYTVANMTKAMEAYSSFCPNITRKTIAATHKYVKISPRNEEDLLYLEKLEDFASASRDEIILHDYPLDYKIVQEGEGYKDPNYSGDELLRPLWTLVPINFEINVPYEVLDEIYQPSENEEDLETVAMAYAGWKDELEEDFGAEVTPENVSNFISCGGIAAKSNKFTPTGTIKVEQTDLGGSEGFKNARLRIGRFIFWHNGNTDMNGYFVDNRTYRGTVRIRSSWRNSAETIRKHWNEVIGIDVSDHLYSLTKKKTMVQHTRFCNRTTICTQKRLPITV